MGAAFCSTVASEHICEATECTRSPRGLFQFTIGRRACQAILQSITRTETVAAGCGAELCEVCQRHSTTEDTGENSRPGSRGRCARHRSRRFGTAPAPRQSSTQGMSISQIPSPSRVGSPAQPDHYPKISSACLIDKSAPTWYHGIDEQAAWPSRPEDSRKGRSGPDARPP
jgi:hypothetical protein